MPEWTGKGQLVWTTELARKVDKASIEKWGISGLTLMEAAGRAVHDSLFQRFSRRRSVLVLAGIGNNGGDGFVAARLLHQSGWQVLVIDVAPAPGQKRTHACETQRQKALDAGVAMASYQAGILRDKKRDNPIILDALFGLGLHGPLRPGPAAECLAEASALSRKTVVAVDVPSGLDADDWTSEKAPLPADLSITFGAAKPVHELSPSRELCGDVIAVNIGFAEAAVEDEVKQTPLKLWRLSSTMLLKDDPWQKLKRDNHKFDRGHVLIIGGSQGKLGAPFLAAIGALRTGAGWVSVAPFAENKTLPVPLELTQETFFEGGKLDTDALANFVATRRIRAVVVGPGTMGPWLTSDIVAAFAECQRAHSIGLVFDAGALGGIGQHLTVHPCDPALTVITPHPGEWRKLQTSPIPLGGTDNMRNALGILKKWGVSALYKSASPMMLSPAEPKDVAFLAGGVPALAKAGSGDVLSGVIAAHLAIGVPAPLAALRAQAMMLVSGKSRMREAGFWHNLPSEILGTS